MKQFVLIALLSLGLIGHAFAANKTVTLSVPGMYCAVCPVTVKKALNQVNGVKRVEVNYDKKEATVVFDDAKAKIADLTWATEEAGYPSKPIAPAKGEAK